MIGETLCFAYPGIPPLTAGAHRVMSNGSRQALFGRHTMGFMSFRPAVVSGERAPVDVLYVIDSLAGGGAEQSLVDIVSDLMACGVRLEVVTLLKDDGLLVADLLALGARHRSLVGLNPLQQLTWLRRTARSGHHDVVHSTLLRADVLSRLACIGVKVPLVTTLPNDSYGKEHRQRSKYGPMAVRLVHLAELATVQRVNSFHAVSATIADTMSRRLLVKRARIDVIWRGRKSARLGRRSVARRHAVRAALGVADDVPLIVCVGRQDFQKALDVALHAHAQLRRSMPEAMLVLVGRSGNASVQLNELLASDIGHGVLQLGHRSDVPDLMCASDVLCFPSRWEGLGGTLLEALALELPIVASSIAPVREAVGDCAAALVEPNDPAALAAALERVLRAPDSSHVTDRGRARFEQAFSSEAAAQNMAAFYGKALSIRDLARSPMRDRR